MKATKPMASRGFRASSRAILYAALILGLSVSALATDVAVLSNGFTIRHEHRQVMGEMTRLYFSADDSSFTDVPTAQITGFEKDLTLPVPPPASASTPSNSIVPVFMLYP